MLRILNDKFFIHVITSLKIGEAIQVKIYYLSEELRND